MTQTPSWPWQIASTTFDGLVRARASATPDATFLIGDDGERLTFGEYDARVDRVAAALSREGIGQGSRVAWTLPTRVSTVLVMGALRRLGAIQAPIIPLYREREMGAAVRTSGSETLLVPGTWRGTDYLELAARLPLEGHTSPLVLEIGAVAPEADPVAGLGEPYDADDIRWIYFTSGSTGTPKGARHTDDTLLTTGLAFGGIGGLGREPGEVAAMAFPIAHVGGIEYLIAALAGGYPVLLVEAFEPQPTLALFKEHGVTTTGGAPPFYQAFVGFARAAGGPPLATLRTLKGGGAPCPPHLFHEVTAEVGCRLAHDYGMTEAPMIGVANPDDADEILAVTDGRVIPGSQVRLVDADGIEVGPGEAGEIQVSGRGVCRGYCDPADTAANFTEDGWFRTGDLGQLRPSGHLEVIGRLKDLIIRKGENIAPFEIETVLIARPEVAECAVIGLPDEERGELVCAVVVPAAGSQPTLVELKAWMAEAGLMPQKVPERLELMDELPRTGLAKVAKQQLRQQLLSTTTEGSR
ncbi:class I adenylate-forming enzyme family protein [Nocardioides ferulae]|uniref:class I adenylate-forming enzyme family protein n=1 Tax=Nocardioides ferulae TaxID=2340821 RepID=UPI00197CFE0A|nr:class I adenylate-forming enzyme family protein [Nocardioides ferulae]